MARALTHRLLGEQISDLEGRAVEGRSIPGQRLRRASALRCTITDMGEMWGRVSTTASNLGKKNDGIHMHAAALITSVHF